LRNPSQPAGCGSDGKTAAEFQRLMLEHGEVENCLHLQKDKAYGGVAGEIVAARGTDVAGSAETMCREAARRRQETRTTPGNLLDDWQKHTIHGENCCHEQESVLYF
jgi:hypothetical protein